MSKPATRSRVSGLSKRQRRRTRRAACWRSLRQVGNEVASPLCNGWLSFRAGGSSLPKARGGRHRATVVFDADQSGADTRLDMRQSRWTRSDISEPKLDGSIQDRIERELRAISGQLLRQPTLDRILDLASRLGLTARRTLP